MPNLTKSFKHPLFPGLEYEAILDERGLEANEETHLTVRMKNNNAGFDVDPNELEAAKLVGPGTLFVQGGANKPQPVKQGETREANWLVSNKGVADPSYTIRIFARPFITIPAFHAIFDMPVTP